MVAATFLPWVMQQGVLVEESASHPFRGGTTERSYSGWELERRCGYSGSFGSCSLPSGSFEGRREMFTGVWTLIIGASFVLVAGCMTLALIRAWRVALRCFLVVSWLVASFAAVVAAAVWWTAADLPSRTFVSPTGPGGPEEGVYRQLAEPVRYGIIVVAVAAGIGLVGTGIATFSGRRKATPASDVSPPTAIAAVEQV
jgi:hypothetical protein